MKKEIYILIGPAAIGKTTFIKNAGFPDGKYRIVSRDEVVARVSKQYNLDFDDLYHFPPHDSIVGSYIPGMEKYGRVINSPSVVVHLHPFSYEYLDSVNAEINYAFYNEFQAAIRDPQIDFIIVDRVHLRHKERSVYENYLGHNRESFITIGVLFDFTTPDILDVLALASQYRTEDMKKRGERYRTVGRSVQENMLKHYESIQEGEFDTVIHVNTIPGIRDFIHAKYAENNFDESGKCPYCNYEIIQLRPMSPDPMCKYERLDPITDRCPSCKKDFIVHEHSFSPELGVEPINLYQTEKLNKDE